MSWRRRSQGDNARADQRATILFGALYGGQTIKGTHLKYISYLDPGYTVFATMAIALGTVAVNLQRLATLLPSERMADALQRIWGKGLGLSSTGQDIPVLLLWTVVVMAIGARRFRWQ